MQTQELLHQLSLLEGTYTNSHYAQRSDATSSISYFAYTNELHITTDFEHEEENENTKPFKNLAPETILDLFRNWKR